MRDAAPILLTGATGYVGRHVLWRLLSEDRRVVVLGRGGEQGLLSRVATALQPLGEVSLTGLQCVEIDLARPFCGLDEQSLMALKALQPAVLLHCAGLTRFDEHLQDRLFRTNLQGTRNVFAMAEAVGIRAFHHVSTAFVAGDSHRPFSQRDLDRGQSFRNPYEASKFEAERFLHQRFGHSSIESVRILRPSIVVGGYALGENNHASTLYSFIKAMRFLRQCCQRDLQRGKGRFARVGARLEEGILHMPLRVALKPSVRINLTPIEHVVSDAVEGLADRRPGIFTRSQLGADFSLESLNRILTRVVGINGLALVDESAFESEPANKVEAFFQRATREYQPYLQRECCLNDAEKMPPASLDVAQLTRDFQAQLDAAADPSISLSQQALSTLQVSSAEDYFARLTTGSLGESLNRRIQFVNSAIRFQIEGEQAFDRVVAFRNGTVVYADEAPADFGYRMAHALFMDIIRGRVDLRKAFFAGRLKIEGNMEAALKFGFLLGEYLRVADDHLLDEVVGL